MGNYHVCTGIMTGNWIIFRCSKCKYEMRDNWRTGEIEIKNASKDIYHSGFYFPEHYKEAFLNVN